MKEFIYQTIVRFSDTDLYGVVHHSNFFRWLEEARCEIMEEVLDMSLYDMEKGDIRFPVIKVDGNYKQPVRAREKITIYTQLEYGDTSKIAFHYRIVNEKGVCVFLGTTQHVVTLNQKMLFKLPEEFYQKIECKMHELKD